MSKTFRLNYISSLAKITSITYITEFYSKMGKENSASPPLGGAQHNRIYHKSLETPLFSAGQRA